MDEIIGIQPTNQKTFYLLRLFYSDNKIITVCGRPAIFTLIGWLKSSHLFSSLSGFSVYGCMIPWQRLKVVCVLVSIDAPTEDAHHQQGVKQHHEPGGGGVELCQQTCVAQLKAIRQPGQEERKLSLFEFRKEIFQGR